MFMNEYEIEDTCRRFSSSPVLGPAALTLMSLCQAANANSDGWAYWPKPTRAASNLMKLLVGNGTNDYRNNVVPTITAAQVRKALVPIKAFRTRSGIDFPIYEPN